MIFGGKVKVLTTCQSCNQQLRIITLEDTEHPCCVGDVDPWVNHTVQGWLSAIMADDQEAARLTANEIYSRTPTATMLEHALAYAEDNWPVFPLRGPGVRCDGGNTCTEKGICQCPKKPATKTGLYAATLDPAKITKWWKAHPNSNIGLPTGNRFDAIDIDPGGIVGFQKWLAQGRLPDIHGIAATGSGGMHVLIEARGSKNHRNMDGYPIDYRGVGGYVVAPHSRLNEDYIWSWMVRPSPTITGLEF